MRSSTIRASLLCLVFLLLVQVGPSVAKNWGVQVKGEGIGPFRFVPSLLSIAYVAARAVLREAPDG